MDLENNKRLEILYTKHNDWLFKVALNLSKNIMDAEDMVQNLYIYLSLKGTPNIYYLDSYNLKYCYSFIRTRFINSKKAKKLDITDDDLLNIDISDIEYNYIEDQIIEETYNNVKVLLKQMKRTNKKWGQSLIFEMYNNTEKKTTIEGLAKKLNLSKSTVFLTIKSVKEIIKQEIEDPFEKIKNIDKL